MTEEEHLTLCFLALDSRSQLLLPGCHYGDGLASPPLWGLLGPGGEPRKSAEYDDDVAIYSE